MNQKTRVESSYAASSAEEQELAYDEWAINYEADLCAMGYRLPAISAAVFARFVAPYSAPVLDAGCGGGLQVEPLYQAGYGPFHGIDFSTEMLAVARRKGIYQQLDRMTLGERLGFDDESFQVILSIGTITPKHAPPTSFDELIRVAKKEALIIFSLRCDAAQDPAYPAAVERHSRLKHWRQLFSTDSFISMPYGEPSIMHQVHVYQRL